MWDLHAFGFAPSESIVLTTSGSDAYYDSSDEDCELRLSWSLTGSYTYGVSGREACSDRSTESASVGRVLKYCAKTAVPSPTSEPIGASSIVGKVFVQQTEADVLEGLECEVVYADAYSSSVSYSSFDAYKASQYTHILVGVKSQEANSTYVVAALDDIHVALKQTTSIHRAQRTSPGCGKCRRAMAGVGQDRSRRDRPSAPAQPPRCDL